MRQTTTRRTLRENSLLSFVIGVLLISYCNSLSTDSIRSKITNLKAFTSRSKLYVASKDIVPTTDVVKPSSSSDIRPLHQNWWPATVVTALDEKRPNPVKILGESLVLVKNKDGWKALQDRCSHRFAPLSEGRIVGETVHCSYHGWEFDCNSGKCVTLPQQPDKITKANSVPTYLTQERVGIIWVWMDSSDSSTNQALASSVQLPISPLLQQTFDTFGPASFYMRDLPYGMELLGENLLDNSHLPFAHHSIAGLDRSYGREMPLRMLSNSEKLKLAEQERQLQKPEYSNSVIMPRYQVTIEDAPNTDPVLLGAKSRIANNPKALAESANWTATAAYYDPCHLRYERSSTSRSNVELFMCPTTEGRSRILVCNCFGSRLSREKLTAKDRLTLLVKPKKVKDLIMRKIFDNVFDVNKPRVHMINHLLFDNDGVFLHKQGRRMHEAGLTYADYSTPSSADILLNAYRRFIDAAANKTTRTSMAKSVVGSDNYADDIPRSVMLDRYNAHTANCPVCLPALQKTRRRQSLVRNMVTMFQGATGASIMSLVCLAIVRRVCSATVHIPNTVFKVVAIASSSTFLATLVGKRADVKLDKQINSFLFEDYVHYDKH